MLSSNCAVCNSKISRFINEQEASAKFLRKVPLAGLILFTRYKMNDILNKSLLARDKFTPEKTIKATKTYV